MASQFADGPTPSSLNLTEEVEVTPDDVPVLPSSGATTKEEATVTATTAAGQEAAEIAAAGEMQINGAAAEAEEAKNSNTNNGDDDNNAAAAAFECNICLDVARDAVVSMCGHLFCWPCLHTWLETRPHRQICPVCKAGIGRDKVVPIYGRSDSNPKDPRDKPLPPRPRGQRPEPESVGGSGPGGFAGFAGGGAGGGGMFQMSFGIGAFPFGLFTTNINMGGGEHPFGAAARMNNQEGSVQLEEEQFLHKAFLWVAFAFIFWLLIA